MGLQVRLVFGMRRQEGSGGGGSVEEDIRWMLFWSERYVFQSILKCNLHHYECIPLNLMQI